MRHYQASFDVRSDVQCTFNNLENVWKSLEFFFVESV